MRRAVPWSEEEDRRLRDLARSGIGAKDIAALMDRSTSVICDHAKRLKIAIANDRNKLVKIDRLLGIGLKAKSK